MPTDDQLTLLIADLASPDPAVRDAGAYSQVATMVVEGRLSAAQTQRLGDVCAHRLADPQVQTRTFAPLILAVLGHAGITQQSWTDAVLQWCPRESDLRGYHPQLGWLHAAAHGADALGELGRARAAAPTVLLEGSHCGWSTRPRRCSATRRTTASPTPSPWS